MTKKFDWNSQSGLPDMSQDALKNYFLYALEPGSFLTALLCDRPWTEVIGRADHWNKTRLSEYSLWLQEYAPLGSWGSEETVRSWLAKGSAYQTFQKTLTWEALNADYTAPTYDF
jgi:hypothetical protein